MTQLLLGCGELVLILALFRAFYRQGFRRGYKDGYFRGRVDAEKWWLEQGAEVDAIRESFFRDELGKVRLNPKPPRKD